MRRNNSKKIRLFVRPIKDMPQWIGLDSIKQYGRFIRDIFTTITSEPRTSDFHETYEQAIERYGLTPTQLAKRQSHFFMASMLYLAFAILMFFYGLHHFRLDMILSGISIMCLVVMLLSFAFREHFWYTQMRHKKLGINFKQWFNALLFGELK